MSCRAVKDAIHPYLGGASLRRVCSHGASDTLLSGSRLANLNMNCVHEPCIRRGYLNWIIVAARVAIAFYLAVMILRLCSVVAGSGRMAE
nr:hypothetical protein [Tanacetum cinerariifolium]